MQNNRVPIHSRPLPLPSHTPHLCQYMPTPSSLTLRYASPSPQRAVWGCKHTPTPHSAQLINKSTYISILGPGSALLFDPNDLQMVMCHWVLVFTVLSGIFLQLGPAIPLMQVPLPVQQLQQPQIGVNLSTGPQVPQPQPGAFTGGGQQPNPNPQTGQNPAQQPQQAVNTSPTTNPNTNQQPPPGPRRDDSVEPDSASLSEHRSRSRGRRGRGRRRDDGSSSQVSSSHVSSEEGRGSRRSGNRGESRGGRGKICVGRRCYRATCVFTVRR